MASITTHSVGLKVQLQVLKLLLHSNIQEVSHTAQYKWHYQKQIIVHHSIVYSMSFSKNMSLTQFMYVGTKVKPDCKFYCTLFMKQILSSFVKCAISWIKF